MYAFRDLTEEHGLEKMRSDFVATVSHELRTPLAAIYGSAQTILRPDLDLDDTVRDELLGVIASESDRLAEIVSDLLLSSHLDSGRLPAADRELRRRRARRRGRRERAHAPARRTWRSSSRSRPTCRAWPPIPASCARCSRTSSTTRSSTRPAAGPSRSGSRTAAAPCASRSQDRGIGMPASELRRIFEKFYRLDPDMTRGIGGTGLGLYISRELVRRMAGTIAVESELGAGSTFVVEIPVAQPQPAVTEPAPARARSG